MIACAQDGTRHRHSVELLVAKAAGAGYIQDDQAPLWE